MNTLSSIEEEQPSVLQRANEPTLATSTSIWISPISLNVKWSSSTSHWWVYRPPLWCRTARRRSQFIYSISVWERLYLLFNALSPSNTSSLLIIAAWFGGWWEGSDLRCRCVWEASNPPPIENLLLSQQWDFMSLWLCGRRTLRLAYASDCSDDWVCVCLMLAPATTPYPLQTSALCWLSPREDPSFARDGSSRGYGGQWGGFWGRRASI